MNNFFSIGSFRNKEDKEGHENDNQKETTDSSDRDEHEFVLTEETLSECPNIRYWIKKLLSERNFTLAEIRQEQEYDLQLIPSGIIYHYVLVANE